MTELTPIPCPFCGSTSLKIESKSSGGRHYSRHYTFSVRCLRCHARGPTYGADVDNTFIYSRDKKQFEQAAIELWNRRSTNT